MNNNHDIIPVPVPTASVVGSTFYLTRAGATRRVICPDERSARLLLVPANVDELCRAHDQPRDPWGKGVPISDWWAMLDTRPRPPLLREFLVLYAFEERRQSLVSEGDSPDSVSDLMDYADGQSIYMELDACHTVRDRPETKLRCTFQERCRQDAEDMAMRLGLTVDQCVHPRLYLTPIASAPREPGPIACVFEGAPASDCGIAFDPVSFRLQCRRQHGDQAVTYSVSCRDHEPALKRLWETVGQLAAAGELHLIWEALQDMETAGVEPALPEVLRSVDARRGVTDDLERPEVAPYGHPVYWKWVNVKIHVDGDVVRGELPPCWTWASAMDQAAELQPVRGEAGMWRLTYALGGQDVELEWRTAGQVHLGGVVWWYLGGESHEQQFRAAVAPACARFSGVRLTR